MPKRRSVQITPVLRPFLLVLGAGTVGYWLIEGVSLWDAFFMTVITVTTVGFREVFPLSTAGQALTVVVAVLGIATVAYGAGEYFTTVRINLARRKLMRDIHRLSDHMIVCGFGRVGENAANTLRDGGRDVLVVDRDAKRIDGAREDGFVAVLGDATHDEVMRQLGVERAAGFLITTGSDTDNLFVVLSARSLNAEMTIVARAADPANVSKFERAGADRVVSPYQTGGRYMANSIVRPNLTEFLDRVTLAGVELWMEEIDVPAESPLVDRSIGEIDLGGRSGASLVALSRTRGDLMTAPPADTRIASGDVLIVLGTKDQLAAVARLAG